MPLPAPPRVFAIQNNPNLNFTPAVQFGDVVYLLPGGAFNISSPMIASVLRLKLADFNPDKDFILPVGAPIAIGLTFALLLKKYKEISYLEYDRIEQKYNLKKASLI